MGWIEIAGWVGAIALLIGYGLLSSGKADSKSSIYQVLNALGSLLLGANAVAHSAYPLVGINVVWFVIAIWSLRANRAKRIAG